ncbi:MAG: HK97 family phage prohead protease [Alphaproteobacteria bacterium]|nr:HK97 family phage prohead protease [Alphaproteobacteria bacterium]
MEKRSLVRPLEVRAASGGRTVAGYAAVFNVQADICGCFQEQIAPGAFSDALAGDVRALINHDTGRVIGRTRAGTLRLAQDQVGLAVEIDLPDTADGRDLATLIERGDISGMSFGFEVTKQTWDETGDTPIRTIQAVNLFEVSAVAFPAYDDTSIAMRSLEAARRDAKARNFNAAAKRLRMKAHLDLAARRRVGRE